MERLAQRQAEGAFPDCDLLTDFQLQVEHALDLIGRREVIFVDAAALRPRALLLHPRRPRAGPELYHPRHDAGRGPASYAQLTVQIAPGPCPTAWLLAIRGYRFGLGEDLSAAAQVNLDASGAFLEDYLNDR